jgi:hypothetical protein
MIVVVDRAKVPPEAKRRDGAQVDMDIHQPARQMNEQKTRVDVPVRSSSKRPGRDTFMPGSETDVHRTDIPIKPKRLEQVTGSAEGPDRKLWSAYQEQNHAGQSYLHEPTAVDSENDLNNEHEYVRRKPSPAHLYKPDRVHVRSDSSQGEPEAPSTMDLDRALQNSVSGGESRAARQTYDEDGEHAEHKLPESLNVFEGFSDSEETPRRNKQSAFTQRSSPSPPPSGTSGADSGYGNSTGKHYMDYLRHPGTIRASSEYNKAASGTSPLSSIPNGEGADKERERIARGGSPDVDCGNSPYSVD